MGVPEVNGEVIYQPLYVGPLAIPLDQAMNCGCVPKIMHPRLETGSVGAPHACILPHSVKRIRQGTFVNGLPSLVEEERAGSGGRRMLGFPPARVIAQDFCQIRTDG